MIGIRNMLLLVAAALLIVAAKQLFEGVVVGLPQRTPSYSDVAFHFFREFENGERVFTLPKEDRGTSEGIIALISRCSSDPCVIGHFVDSEWQFDRMAEVCSRSLLADESFRFVVYALPAYEKAVLELRNNCSWFDVGNLPQAKG